MVNLLKPSKNIDRQTICKLSTFHVWFSVGHRVPILGVIEPLYFLSLCFGLNLLRYIFLIFSLQALIIIAWNGGAPSDIFYAR
ncbi:hypothetical protein ACJX0J_012163, partial [Zea mays]